MSSSGRNGNSRQSSSSQNSQGYGTIQNPKRTSTEDDSSKAFKNKIITAIIDGLQLAGKYSIESFGKAVEEMKNDRKSITETKALKSLDAMINFCTNLLSEDRNDRAKATRIYTQLDRKKSVQHFRDLAEETKRILDSTGKRQFEMGAVFARTEEVRSGNIDLSLLLSKARNNIDLALTSNNVEKCMPNNWDVKVHFHAQGIK
ncbi:uncharacterized protein FOMMEDRAFT_31692 [Fomitiporia mediterranea MF3/22]|uniref:uncharacterized protein n=1 Tax=Fomitiporia mediterranea (strain MF3/22) TaxID=694068 RepID=UPI0004407CCD|nr:uncharacterized protein FOMMEDRAFT_31692 [Fomitiporia mediterranea MF3/22]EJC98667.1 hypothetical protein FOMMEDRAFT_31692 [Fomitiporia mediterranea MF3/22]